MALTANLINPSPYRAVYNERWPNWREPEPKQVREATYHSLVDNKISSLTLVPSLSFAVLAPLQLHRGITQEVQNLHATIMLPFLMETDEGIRPQKSPT